MNENYPILVKSYQLTLWYIQKLTTLPKGHRFTIAEKIQKSLLDLMLLLSDAIYTKARTPLLDSANKEIERLRLLTRLLKDLAMLSTENYRFVIASLDELGKMVGGWRKG